MNQKATAEANRLVILMNDLPPYRVPIYRDLGHSFEVSVLLGGREDNRKWEEETRASRGFSVRRTRGLTIKRHSRNADGLISDIHYTQLPLGAAVDLVQLRPDAVISTEMGLRSIIAVLYGLLTRTPIWLWWGGTVHTEKNRSFPKKLLRRWFFAPLVKRWISYGVTSSEYLRSIGVSKESILQIQNSANHDAFSRSDIKSLDLPGPSPKLLFVGQLIGRKGIVQLMRATTALQKRGVEFSLVIVGDGPESARIAEMIKSDGIRNITMITYMSPRDLANLYRSCDLLVFPTLEDNWGLVVNEALMSDLPVLVSKYAGCAKELADPAQIFDPLDHDQFVQKLESAVLGEFGHLDMRRPWPAGEVAKVIAKDIFERLRRTPQRDLSV